jgi:hypothetical protein
VTPSSPAASAAVARWKEPMGPAVCGLLLALVCLQAAGQSAATLAENGSPTVRSLDPVSLAIPQDDEYAANNTGVFTFKLHSGFRFSTFGDVAIQSYPGRRPALSISDYENVWLMDGSSRCHAVSVGPRVLLTAGHCLDRGANFSARTTPMGPKVSVHCTAMDKTISAPCNGTSSCEARRDLALCIAEDNLRTPPDGFESIAATALASGEVDVRIPAFGGCPVTLRTLYGDPVTATWPPTNGIDDDTDRMHLAVTKAIYEYTCDGDSGTGWLTRLGSGRRVVAIQVIGSKTTVSKGAVLSDKDVQQWLKSQAKTKGVELCGLSNGLATSTCR